MQEDCRILLASLKDAGNWCEKTWRYTRASGLGHWFSSLPEAVDPNLPSRGFEGGTGAK
jgi:hypothetical protein